MEEYNMREKDTRYVRAYSEDYDRFEQVKVELRERFKIWCSASDIRYNKYGRTANAPSLEDAIRAFAKQNLDIDKAVREYIAQFKEKSRNDNDAMEAALRQATYEPTAFDRLKDEVISQGICNGCGSCAAVCTANCIQISGGEPMQIERDISEQELGKLCLDCGVCMMACPKTSLLLPEVEKKWGVSNNVWTRVAKSSDQGILNVCQDGGIVTSLLWYAMDRGIINSTVVIGMDDWKPAPRIVTSYQDLLETSGSKYSPSASFSVLSPQDAIIKAVQQIPKDWIKLGFVGTPCQILAARKMQVPGSEGVVLSPSDKIKLTIGLFCMEQFNPELVDHLGVDKREIKKLNIKKEGLIVTLRDERQIIVPHKELKKFVKGSCAACTDFTSKYADISVGSVGSPEGWSTVIVRTELGREVYMRALSDGYLIEPKFESPVYDVIDTMTAKKATRSTNTLQQKKSGW
jgi:coenzyme F420 hydrogenase subunit beta